MNAAENRYTIFKLVLTNYGPRTVERTDADLFILTRDL